MACSENQKHSPTCRWDSAADTYVQYGASTMVMILGDHFLWL